MKGGLKYEIDDRNNPKIVNYESKFTVLFGWLIPHRGSIFPLSEQLIISGILVGICTALGYASCDNMSSLYCVSLPTPNTSSLTLMTLSSFVLAFFMNMIIQRWWSVRSLLNVIIARSNNIVSTLVGILSAKVRSVQANQRLPIKTMSTNLIKNVSGYLLLYFRLVINAARGEKNLKDLVEKGYITPADQLYFHSIGPVPVHATVLLNIIIQDAANAGLLETIPGTVVSNLGSFMDDLRVIRAQGIDIGMYINTQLPFPFIQIVSAVVYGLLIQLVYVSASFISEGVKNKDNSLFTTGYLTILLYSFVHLGLLKLFVVLENPLGYDPVDLPTETYFKALENSFRTMESSFSLLLQDSANKTSEQVINGPMLRNGSVAVSAPLVQSRYDSWELPHDTLLVDHMNALVEAQQPRTTISLKGENTSDGDEESLNV